MGISYSPAVSPDTHSLALGLATMGNALSQAMEQKAEEEKKRGQLAKTLRSYATQSGILPKEQADQLGLEDLQGSVQAAHFKQEMQDRQQKQQLLAAQLLELRDKANSRQSLSAFTGDLATRMQPNLGPLNGQPDDAGDTDIPTPGQPLPEALLAALGRNPGATSSPDFDNMMKILQPGGAASRDFQFDPAKHVTPIAALPGMFYGQSGPHQGQFLQTPERIADVATARETPRVAAQKQIMDYHEKLRAKVQIATDPNNPGQYIVKGDPADVQSFAASSARLNAIKALTDAKAAGAKKVRFEANGQPSFDPFFGKSEPIDTALDRLHAGDSAAEVPTSGPAGGTSLTSPPSGKVTVTKDGKKFLLPAAQLEDAKRQGYQLVVPAAPPAE